MVFDKRKFHEDNYCINKIKEKNPMIVLIIAEKRCDKLQNTFMVKTLNKPEIGIFFYLKKGIYEKPMGSFLFNDEMLEASQLKNKTVQPKQYLKKKNNIRYTH